MRYLFDMVDGHVLVLNRLYQPVNITNVRRALCMMVIGAARALDTDWRLFDFVSWQALATELGEDVILTTRAPLRVPRIVVLQAYARVPVGRIRFSRHNIFSRDGYTCQYCATSLPRRSLNLDHVIPRALAGKTNWENVVTSCVACNCKKGCRTPAQAKMTLVRQPKRPEWRDLLRPAGMRPHHRAWLPFLSPVDASYWNTELDSD